MAYADPEKRRAAGRERTRRWRERQRKRRLAELAAVTSSDPIPGRRELLALAWVRAQQGSTSAARLLLEELRRDEGDAEP